MRKTVKKEIRKHVKEFEVKITCEIIEECGSSKKLWKELSQGQGMLVNLVNKKGVSISNRKLMIEEMTDFYRRLYGRYNEAEAKVMKGDGRIVEEYDEVPRILQWEVEN